MLEWLRSFLNELQVPQHPTLVHEGNEAAIKLAQGLSFSATSRHIVVFVKLFKISWFVFNMSLLVLSWRTG